MDNMATLQPLLVTACFDKIIDNIFSAIKNIFSKQNLVIWPKSRTSYFDKIFQKFPRAFFFATKYMLIISCSLKLRYQAFL